MDILACSAPNCEAPVAVKKRQLCKRHYNRFMSYGDLDLEPVATRCLHCGEQIVRSKKTFGPSPQYCTIDCRRLANDKKAKESGRYAAYEAKRRESFKPKPISDRSCVRCGGSFLAKRSDARFCSTRCTNSWLDEHNPIRCSEDGCDRGVRATGLCSMHWRRVARADGRESNPEWDDRRRANYHKRRALKALAPAEDVRPKVVYDRDSWICGLCSLPVDSSLSYPDPMSASLDHILPLSRGGHHTYENTQLAHLSCNVRKGADAA